MEIDGDKSRAADKRPDLERREYHRSMAQNEQTPQPFQRIPEELQERSQWVNWRIDDEQRKVPVNPHTLRNAGVTWPKTWSEFGQARDVAIEHDLGLGFVLTESDPYTCVDLDACVGSQGSIDGRTREILDLLSGWVELSPSGTGLHVWVRNDEPVSRRTKRLEVYSYWRWMSVTGRSNPEAPLEIPDRTAEVKELFERFMPRVEQPTRIPTQPIPLSDLEVWQQLFDSERGDFYASLCYGDLSVCGDDHSLAVILLANQLASMTDGDAGRMKGLLYDTRLVRDKWEEKRGSTTWIDYQIQDAIAYMSGRQT